MPWKIKFVYDTGNTFETEEGVEGWLKSENQSYSEDGFVWDKLEDAQQALERMGEHYRWQDSLATTYCDDLPKPDWIRNRKAARGAGHNWYFNTKGNDEEEIWFYAGTYLGYFETLVSAEIVAVKPSLDENKIIFK